MKRSPKLLFLEMNSRRNVGVENHAKRDLTQNEQDALDRFKAKDKELVREIEGFEVANVEIRTLC